MIINIYFTLYNLQSILTYIIPFALHNSLVKQFSLFLVLYCFSDEITSSWIACWPKWDSYNMQPINIYFGMTMCLNDFKKHR